MTRPPKRKLLWTVTATPLKGLLDLLGTKEVRAMADFCDERRSHVLTKIDQSVLPEGRFCFRTNAVALVGIGRGQHLGVTPAMWADAKGGQR